MSVEWVQTKVADLKVGDEVREWGVIGHVSPRPENIVNIEGQHWPAHALVDVRRPPTVTVSRRSWYSSEKGSTPYTTMHAVDFDGDTLANFRYRAHAEEYAERLRNDADRRRQALGQ